MTEARIVDVMTQMWRATIKMFKHQKKEIEKLTALVHSASEANTEAILGHENRLRTQEQLISHMIKSQETLHGQVHSLNLVVGDLFRRQVRAEQAEGAELIKDAPVEMTHCANCGQEVKESEPHKVGACHFSEPPTFNTEAERMADRLIDAGLEYDDALAWVRKVQAEKIEGEK